MRVTINGEELDMPITLKRGETAVDAEELYVGDRQVTRVTHSMRDDIPVIVQIDEEVIEVAPEDFYAISGMHRDWQPGDASQSLTAG